MGIPITANNMTESAKVKCQNIKISAGFLPLERERPLGLLLEEFLRKKIRLKVSRFPGLQVDLVLLSLPSLRKPGLPIICEPCQNLPKDSKRYVTHSPHPSPERGFSLAKALFASSWILLVYILNSHYTNFRWIL